MLRPPLDAGGPVPRIAELLAGALRELDCDVSTACWGSGAGGHGVLRRVARCAVDLGRVHRLAGQRHPDVLFVHSAHDPRALARDLPLLGLMRRRVPGTVVMLHGSYSQLLGPPGHPVLTCASRMLTQGVDLLLVLSSEELRQWRAFVAGARPRVERVDNPFLARPIQAVAPGSSETAFRILFVGRILREKGVFDLVDALGQVEGGPTARLTVVGDGPDFAELVAYVGRSAVGDRVELLGRLGARDVGRAYADADALVLPTYYREGFPTVLSEAMAAGLPIVTTSVRGTADHLEDGVNALFVPPRDPHALAQALRELRSNGRLRDAMAATNRAKVAAFAPSLVAARYLELIRTAFGGTVRPPR